MLIPLGVWLVRRLIPPRVLANCRAAVEAGSFRSDRAGQIGAALIALLWLLTIVACVWVDWRWWN